MDKRGNGGKDARPHAGWQRQRLCSALRMQVSRMKSDFFQQKPADVRNASDRVVEKMDVGNMFYDAGDGTKVFRVCFDVGQFSPEEIELRTQDHRLTVHAVHQQQGDDAVTTTTTTTIVERGTLEL